VNVIQIDLKVLRFNLRRIGSFLKSGTKMLLVVKRDAYGHGMIRVVRAARRMKAVVYLGVSCAEEALCLRRAGVRTPILVLAAVPPAAARGLLLDGITFTVSSLEEAIGLNRLARQLNRKASVHVELDTGMGRLGVWCAEAVWLLYKVSELKHLHLEGAFTHFPSADEDDPHFSRFQIEVFDKAIDITNEILERRLRYVHMANSMGLVTYRDSHFSLVRPGILIYGVNPTRRKLPIPLKPVLRLRSRVSFIKMVEKGRSISYARTYVVNKATRIATVPLGYSHGYPLSLSNRSSVIIRGKRYPVVGRITMDHLMVDIGMRSTIRLWDEVTLIGRDGREEIRVEELAQKAKTIPYEILCALHTSIPRIYTE